MMGLHFMDEVPFKDVYLHALVRDKDGKKMSKSTGNVIDPLVVMAEYGTDALRYTMTAFAAQGRDIRLSEERIEGYRHFMNKIWNAARFSLMHINSCDPAVTKDVQPATMALSHRWILSRLNKTITEVHDSLAGFRFNDTASAMYQFIWHEFCDWYLEWIKSDLYGEDAGKKAEAQTVLFTVLESILKLLHPIAPFISEEIWHILPGNRPTLMTESYPVANPTWDDQEAEESAILIMGVIGGIRNIRSEMQIHPSAEIEALAICPDPIKQQRLQDHAPSIMGLTRTAKLDVQASGPVPQGAANYIFEDIEIVVPLKGLIDVEKEIAKLNKNKEKIEKQANQTKGKLSNEKFLSNAPDDIIAKENGKLDEFTTQLTKIDETIARLQNLA